MIGATLPLSFRFLINNVFINIFLFFHFQILFKLGIVIYSALDFKLAQDEECIISQDLEHLINFMTYEGKLF